MNISILTCPHCNAMVLSDAGRCHVCDHVLDQERVDDSAMPNLPTDQAVAQDLDVCVHCGETYRSGLVRCWNCGQFTRDEIAAAYEKMTSDPDRYTYREHVPDVNQPLAPEATQRSGPWKISANSAQTPPASPASGAEELAASDDDFSFELADSVQLTDATHVAREEESGEVPTYNLATAADESPAVIPSLNAGTSTASPEKSESKPDAATTAEPEAVKQDSADETRKPHSESEVAHSEATGGDVLLNIAMEEEADLSRSRKTYASKIRGGFVVFCPMGCRIRVQERHRGKAGKCPKCHSVFFVPRAKPKPAAAESSATSPAATPAVEKWRGQLVDVHLHHVVPAKLRIKPDSLLNEFSTVDVTFSDEGMLLSTLVVNPGFLGANLKKKPALREALREHLKKVGTVEGAPGEQHRLIPTDSLTQLVLAQPSPADVESLFGNIPVFGTGRIAVRLPRSSDDGSTQYLSFSLTEFRAFSAALDDVCGIAGFGAETEIPLTETYNSIPCHYSDAPVRELLGIEYYQKDPQVKLKIAGWRCGGCALMVSEDSRKKEKIGGLNGKSIASAKCPKCGAKFGKHPIYEVETLAATPAQAASPQQPADAET